MDFIAIQSPCSRHRQLGMLGAQAGAGALGSRLGAGLGVRRRGRETGTGVGAEACAGRADRPGARGRARGAQTGKRWACRGPRSAGRAAGRRAGRRLAQAAGAGARAERHGVGRAECRRADAWGAVAGAGRARPGRWVRGLCAQAGPVGCSCTWLGFQPGFFDSVFFLSHQMNTVHCKINFEKKKFLI